MGQNKQSLMSAQQQAAMQRLASEQSAVRKSLQQLIKEMGNKNERLGDLGQVSKEMQEVVNQLQQRQLNRTTLERQQRILSRLLDAQRAMHTRDYSKKRQAETGKQFTLTSPSDLPMQDLLQKDRLKNELLRAMKEGYSRDYRDLIRRYFEALAKEQESTGTN